MPFDPNSPRNPLPPLNDGYPDDWHVPPSAQGDSFPDDWHVPPSAQDDSFPDDWHVPPSAQGDRFPDDWFVPETAAVPSASQPTPTAQPNIANPNFAPQASPSGPFAAAWSGSSAEPQHAAVWATPTLAEMVANLTAPLSNPAPGMLFGGASPTPPNTDTPFLNPSQGIVSAGTGGLSGSLFFNQDDSSSVAAPLPRAQDADFPASGSRAPVALLRSNITPAAPNVGLAGKSVLRTPPKEPPLPETSPLMADKSAPYSSDHPNYHDYEFEDKLCDMRDPGCTMDRAYEALLRHAVPGNPEDGTLIVDGKESPVSLLGESGGLVRTWTEPSTLSIVNTTEPGHVFQDGVVQRQIVRRGNSLYIRTHGRGNNTSPEMAFANVWLAKPAFLASTNSIRAWLRQEEGGGGW